MPNLWIQGKQYSLKPGSNLVGKGGNCNIQLHHPTISTQHLSVELAEDGSVTVVDLGSANGLWVEGKRIPSITFQNQGEFEAGGVTCRLT